MYLEIKGFSAILAILAFSFFHIRNPRTNSPLKRYILSKIILAAHFIGNGNSPPSHITPQKLPSITKLEEISGKVIRIVGNNPGKFTLQGTNTYLVGQGKNRILIDTGAADDDWFTRLKKVVQEEDCEIEHVLISHRHIDHEGGNENVRALFPEAKLWKFQSNKGLKRETDVFGNVYRNLEAGQRFDLGDCSLTVIPTPGHTSDHCCFSLEDRDAGTFILFSADCVLGSSTPVFSNLSEYMSSLAELKQICMNALDDNLTPIILPGHGPVVEDAIMKLDEYIGHRMEREVQIIEMVKRESMKKSRSKPVEVEDMVKEIYDYKNLNFIIRRAARSTIKHHVSKLEKENRLIKRGSGYVLAKDD